MQPRAPTAVRFGQVDPEEPAAAELEPQVVGVGLRARDLVVAVGPKRRATCGIRRAQQLFLRRPEQGHDGYVRGRGHGPSGGAGGETSKGKRPFRACEAPGAGVMSRTFVDLASDLDLASP